jgi:hypothetical protein
MSDETNKSPLGKTAHYDPSSLEVVVYVDGRHPKDIMRSFSHELVHHNQNENGMFDKITGQTGAGYAQSNPHLRKMEKEAYLKGNMCFRDWEDGYKSSNPNILNERRIYKMSTKDWKDKELNGLLNERWGFSMNLDKLNESSCGSHKRDDDESLEEEKCPKCKGKGCPDCATKNEEKKNMVKDPKTGKMVPDYAIDGKGNKDLKEEEINEISMGLSSGNTGTNAEESDKDAVDRIKKGAKNLKYKKQNTGNKNLRKEEESKDFGPKTDMTKLSDEEEEKFLNAISAEKLRAALKKKEQNPKEAKLREAIRRIIKKQLRL